MPIRKLFISADIEGVAGVVTRNEAFGNERDYAMGRQWMTAEVNAACGAALDAGIEQIVIADSHGGGNNLLLDELPDCVEVVRSWPRELMMMQGIEQGPFVGAALIGYHAGSRSMTGVMAHSFSGDILEICVNGEVMSETTFNAALAGHFGVPIIMASGDDAYTSHVNDVLPDTETATVKWSHGALSARSLTPAKSCEQIAGAMGRALSKKCDYRLCQIAGPIEVEIETSNRVKAELLAYLPGVTRISSHRNQFVVEDMPAASRCISVYINLNPSSW